MIVDLARPTPQPAISYLLESSLGACTLEDLPKFFEITRITFTYQRPPDLEGGFRLPAAIRGALGEPLRQVSQERYGVNSSLPSPFPGLYADHFKFDERWHVPKPFVIWTRVENNRIYVEISLFGLAGRWKDDLIEAMLRIMLPKERGGQGGIRLMGGRSPRRPWHIEDVFWRVKSSFEVPPVKPVFVMTSTTPFILGGQGILSARTGDLFFTIFARLAGLMHWHQMSAAPELKLARIRETIKDIRHSFVLEPKIVDTIRKSRNFQGRGKLERGVLASIRIEDYPHWLWPGFYLGTFTHAGYDVVQGYGRYGISDP